MINCCHILYGQLRRLNGAPVILKTENGDEGAGIIHVDRGDVYVFNNVACGREPDDVNPIDFGYEYSWCVAGRDESDTDRFIERYSTRNLFLTTLKGE